MQEARQTPISQRITALTASGVFALTGCTVGSPDFNPSSSLTATSAPSFSFDTLNRTNEGVCANPRLAKIALENCIVLPPVTKDAHFSVLADPDDGNQYDDVANEERKIADFHGTTANDEKLSPAYKAALQDVMDDSVPAAALATGTRIVIEQQTGKNVWPHFISENNTVRMNIATDGEPASLGETRAVLTHESAHAVTDNWEWSTEEDAAILDAYSAELYLGIEKVRKEHGGEFATLLKKLDHIITTDYKNNTISKKARDVMLRESEDLRGLIKVTSGLGVVLVQNSYGADVTALKPFRSFLLEKVSNKDIDKMRDKSQAVTFTSELDKKLAGYLAERFSYVTEYKNMDGMVEWNLGHPWDNTGEYIASLTANVELAPDAFVASVQAIKGSRNKTVITLVKGIANKYKKESPELYEKSNFPYVLEQLAS